MEIPSRRIVTHLLAGLVAPYLPGTATAMIARLGAGIVLLGQMRIMTSMATIDIGRVGIKSPLSRERGSNITQEVGRAHR